MKDRPHTDVFGNALKVGDFVAYAASLGRSPILKVALILELRTKEATGDGWHDRAQHKVSVRTAERKSVYKKGSHNGYIWELQKMGSPLTLEFTERMMRVAPSKIPAEVRSMLKNWNKDG